MLAYSKIIFWTGLGKRARTRSIYFSATLKMPRVKKEPKVPKEKKPKEKQEKSTYKKAKNGRVYKLVNGRPRFVSKKEASENGF